MFCIRSAFLLVLQFVLLVSLTQAAFAQTWINSVSVSTTTTTATIRWTTAVPANSQIKYGTTQNYGRRNGLDSSLVTAHAMTLSSLVAETSYHFRAMSADASGALVTSMDYTFTMPAGPISVSVTPVTATVVSGGTQQFSAAVSNCSDPSVTWSATAGAVSGSGLFTAPTVASDQTVTVTAKSVADPTKSASAMVTVKAPAPVLVVSPTSLVFSAQAGGGNPASANISVTNTGGGSLNFTASTDVAWLALSPASGSAPSSPQVAVAIAGLVPGTYTGHITVTAAGSTGSPFTVTAVLTITAPPVAHSVDLTWSASTSSNVVSYSTYRSTVPGGPYELIASAITGLAYTDRAVTPGATYYYVVTAIDDDAQESGYSGEAKAVVPSP
jgi:hypothetical protein